jgi:hypothetical protein
VAKRCCHPTTFRSSHMCLLQANHPQMQAQRLRVEFSNPIYEAISPLFLSFVASVEFPKSPQTSALSFRRRVPLPLWQPSLPPPSTCNKTVLPPVQICRLQLLSTLPQRYPKQAVTAIVKPRNPKTPKPKNPETLNPFTLKIGSLNDNTQSPFCCSSHGSTYQYIKKRLYS